MNRSETISLIIEIYLLCALLTHASDENKS